MKTKILLSVSVIVVVATGVVIGRVMARPQKRSSVTPSTIVYKMTEYGVDGQVVAETKMTRRQYSNGEWRIFQEGPNGQTYNSRGKFSPETKPTAEEYRANTTDRLQSSLLGYSVIIQTDPSGQVWYAPDLDTKLKSVIYDENGELSSVTEATEIEVGEPIRD